MSDPDGPGLLAYRPSWTWEAPMHVRVAAGMATGLALPLARALVDLDPLSVGGRSARVFASWVLLPCAVFSLLPMTLILERARFLGVSGSATTATALAAFCLLPWFAAHTRASRNHLAIAATVAVPLLLVIGSPLLYTRPYPNWWFDGQEAYGPATTLAAVIGVWFGGVLGDVFALAPATLRGERMLEPAPTSGG